MIPIDEKYIIKKLKAGDNEAYKYIYDYHYVALCKLSYYFLKDKVQAESIVNDVIFHLWEIRDKLELVPPLRNYLIVAVRNKCLSIVKHGANYLGAEIGLESMTGDGSTFLYH